MIDISVRDTIKSDLIEIFRIRNDERVVPFQYPIPKHDTLESWQKVLDGDNRIEPFTIKHSTVQVDDNVAGHIIELHYEIAEIRYVQCGWNLEPNYWGQGIMPRALRMKFNAFFLEQEIGYVFSDCFWNNRRCIGVLKRLGFLRQHIPIFNRLRCAYASRCLKWIIRFRLDSENWIG